MTTYRRLRFTPKVYADAHDAHTAICDELHLAASGKTQEEAMSNLQRMALSYCGALSRRGLLEKMLSESMIHSESFSVDLEPGEMLIDVEIRREP